MKYVKVAIDNTSDHTDALWTYKCEDDQVRVGSRVRVPFGIGNTKKTAYVFRVDDENIDNVARLKSVIEIDDSYTVPEDLMKICEWMREKYLCRYIDAVKCVIPPGEAPKRNARKDPFADMQAEPAEAPALTDEQQLALDTVVPAIEGGRFESFLINGVTISGKTEIYMRITEEVISRGKKAIILVPEISLTPQTIGRFMSRFGQERVAVTHSRMTKGQRYDQWKRVDNGGADILIGVRSGVFAPVDKLGAIIIDEEHEASYKSDMTPKYDAIEVALQRCRMSGAVTVLGTATPSVMSRYRADNGIYREIKLLKRYNKTPLPHVKIVDMRDELKRGNKSMFSIPLYNTIKRELADGRQAILFLNRRGYSSFVACRSCGYVMKCETCDLSMTYHKSSGKAECHYCGRKVAVPDKCPECGSPYIRHFGTGTEKVEELAREIFPGAEVARLDLDAVSKKGEADRILNAFKKGKTQILVGTQLVAKGLDFNNVGVVGIISADITLNIPDYRSAERTYQLIVQAAGRAGRGDRAGNVIIQTYSPEESCIRAAAAADYDAFYREEIRMRRLAGYPPYTNIIRLVFSDENEDNVIDESKTVYERLAGSAIAGKGEVLAPQPAYMAHLNNVCRHHLVIKSPLEKTEDYLKLVSEIKAERLKAEPKTLMLVEVDPYSFT